MQRESFGRRFWMVSAMLLGTAAVAVHADAADYPIRPVPFTDVRLEGGLWGPRIETNRRVTVWYDFQKCEETGRIDNFAVAGGLQEGGFQGIFYNDSDVYKVIEGAAYCLAAHPDPKLEAYLDELIDKIAAAQEEDGYLYTARTIGDPRYNYPGKEARWSHLASGHELYNVGHLYEAAVAHHAATGKRNLLDVAIKSADLVCRVFGPGEGQRLGVPGHEEIEIGLVKLYRLTGDEKYLRQAKFFIDMRGRSNKRKTFGEYAQDHKPVLEQQEAAGHAVRAGYLYAGMADVAALTGDEAYVRAIDRLWNNIVSRRMYLTGGVGASRHGEAFGGDYELPNADAYNETCAAIAQALFNNRMFLLHGDAKYIDVLERILYNGFLAGVSLEGDRFFYPNPLACDGATKFNQGVLGRSPWFDCSCCPVNVVRFLPAVPGYVYAVRDEDVYLNLFSPGEGRVHVAGQDVTLSQRTQYPWEGRVTIRIEPARPADWTLRMRIPGWLSGRPLPSDLYDYVNADQQRATISVNGQKLDFEIEAGYAVVKRQWSAGDEVQLEFPMPIRRVVAHEAVEANRGRIALERGPIVYCVESVDHDGSVAELYVPEGAELRPEYRPGLLGGTTILRGTGRRVVRAEDGTRDQTPVPITAIPYYAWAHRQVGEMAVWLPESADGVELPPDPTLASRSRATASHVWTSDSPQAANDLREPQSSGDGTIPRHTWWDRRGTQEWIEYDFPEPTLVAGVEIYWFDDTGRGQCRVPASWRVLNRDGDQWRPVADAGDYGVAKDRYNEVRFDPVTTSGLRVEVELQPDYSGGVLEWRVLEP